MHYRNHRYLLPRLGFRIFERDNSRTRPVLSSLHLSLLGRFSLGLLLVSAEALGKLCSSDSSHIYDPVSYGT